ncbi:hypothetical protein V501_07115 [Pseudogymnoascus sp. VKM F-4519 (FW-2642)]|nr:hypothetical protein V501_07115 [Pseudogymnoascus sp. VKM F-4519 (FW-2642)]
MDNSIRFTLFQDLPTELRFKIWEYALPSHVIVDFIPKPGSGELLMAAGELHSVRPVLSMDHSHIARACKEAWQVMKRPYHRVEFAAGTAESPYYYADWIDFSKTTFYVEYGLFSSYCVRALTPEPISTHVQTVAVPWSNYGELIRTCKSFSVFQTLQRIIILVPPNLNRRLPPSFRDAMTILDHYLQGKINQISDPEKAGSHLRDEVKKFVRYHFAEHGLQCPAIEAVFVPDPV